MADEGLHDWLRLSLVAGVGPRILQALLARFASPTAILDAAPSELQEVPGVGNKISRAIAAARQQLDIQSELALCRQHEIQILTPREATYPRLLKEIADPPVTLFVQGELQPADAVAIAIVGSRHATRYGLAQAKRLAAGLARAGVTIISGLARGIDVAAQQATLQAGGRTLAVLGGGLLNLYPPEHQEIAEDIRYQGAVLSEMPPRFMPTSNSFPQRNRIISGLALGTVIVEAAERSGALITARHAMEQGREVFAVPGPIDSRASRGCHALIRDGAKLVQSVDDILEELGPLVEPSAHDDGAIIRHPAELKLNETEKTVLQAIDSDATSIDAVVQATRLPVQRVLSTLSVLEMKRLVVRISGNQVARR
ncbi:MAG: DNA-protecting protein DprA [Planctomycetales bacterium]|nr:DNA-protecting protein DprA [Planctomycetales bacterium]NIM08985.1 DNA-protecting protein DprA [Planctomycetales bacterium]NIN08448.1 DNA-protecting protein DprA [Planctomycetales bacterium]NIN77582.1 DNA-protecting protein DprA [Planctomycetales bacterium]NIO34747.1 DNA-protecting protein DprA [Planctomycetales bacterium]